MIVQLVTTCALLYLSVSGLNAQSEWMRQFGTAGSDTPRAVAADATGIYVAGTTSGALPGQTNAGGYDAFLQKYDRQGALLWTRQFGTSADDRVAAIAVDPTGVYVTGDTSGALQDQANAGSQDAFVRKYDLNGNLLWTRQFGTVGPDFAAAVAVGGTGVYVAGSTFGTLPEQSNAGDYDAFVRKYDANGNLQWTRQFGTATGESATAAAADDTAVYIAGGFSGPRGADVYVTRFDASGNRGWTRQLSSDDLDSANALAVGSSGVYVGGTTWSLLGQARTGYIDAFLAKFDPTSGDRMWLRQFGTFADDGVNALAVDRSAVYVGGSTYGAFPGQVSTGGSDAFVQKYDIDGSFLGWTRQFGTSNFDHVSGVAVDGTGLYILGSTLGAFADETSAGFTDGFLRRVDTPINTVPAPEITGILNGASYSRQPGLNSAIALGSIFVVTGEHLGPGELRQATGFPLSTSLAGTSIRITSGNVTVDAPLLYTSERQLAAILPSSFPLDSGSTMAVTFEGRTSQWALFNVLRSVPGVFSGSQDGTGQAVAQNFNSATDQPLNTLTRPAQPGQVITLWGTGLGPAPSDTAPAVPRDLDVNLQLFVGGRRANVLYKGRSGCCAGLDQIVFEVPRDVEGCFVPVVMQVDRAVSNFTTISVAPPDKECTDLSGLTGPRVENLRTGGELRLGRIVLEHWDFFNEFFQDYEDSGFAEFLRGNLARLNAVRDRGVLFSYPSTRIEIGLPSPGSCLVSPMPMLAGREQPAHLDAGPVLNFTGPKGTRQVSRQPAGGYSAQFSSSAAERYVEPGTYSADNDSGGADIGGFRVSFPFPLPRPEAVLPKPGEPLVVTWTGGDPAGYVTIRGQSRGQSGTLFQCTERISAGRFAVPDYVLSSLPSLPAVSLSVPPGASPSERFSAPGLDLGYLAEAR